jgi:hypothetical protein
MGFGRVARPLTVAALATGLWAGLASRPALAGADLASGLDLTGSWQQLAAADVAPADDAADAALPAADKAETKTGRADLDIAIDRRLVQRIARVGRSMGRVGAGQQRHRLANPDPLVV